MLTFDEPSHVYRWDGTRVPSVTQALSLINDYSKVDPVKLEIARQEGVNMHRMAELYFLNDLAEDTLPEWMRPRLDALKRFVAETGFELLATESRMYHPRYRFAGTADLFGVLPRLLLNRKPVSVIANIDIKRSFFAERSLGLQTGAYTEMWNLTHPNERVTHRFGLRFLATGEYRLMPCPLATDFANFLSCLNVHRLKEAINA